MRKSEVNRRNFIKVMTGGSSIILIPSVLSACSNGDTANLEGPPLAESSRRLPVNMQATRIKQNPAQDGALKVLGVGRIASVLRAS